MMCGKGRLSPEECRYKIPTIFKQDCRVEQLVVGEVIELGEIQYSRISVGPYIFKYK